MSDHGLRNGFGRKINCKGETKIGWWLNDEIAGNYYHFNNDGK